MAVASRANATVANSGAASTNSPSVTKPTGTVAGDVVVLVISAGGGTSASITAAPTGFTLTSVGQKNNGASVAQWVYYRVCDGTEGASFSATLDSARPWSMVACGYTGVDNNNPISGQSSNTTSPSSTAVVFANYSQHSESDFLINAVTTRNTTAARTVTTASTGFTKRGDTSNTVSAFTQTAIEDSANSGSTLQLIAIANTTMSAAVLQTCTQTIGLRAAVTNLGFDIDVAFNNIVTGSTTAVTSDSFKTGYANEIVLVIAQYHAGGAGISFTLSNTFGLTFHQIALANSQEVVQAWYAVASNALSAGTITATLSAGTGFPSISVYTIANMDTITVVGNSTTGTSASGTPSASITTNANGSWVWGAIAQNSTTDSTVGAAQTKLSSDNDGVGREIVQRQTATTATAGTNVTINQTAPTAIAYDMVAFELLAAVAATPIFPPANPLRIANRMVGPMALRRMFRQPYVPTTAVAVNQPPFAPTLLSPADTGTAGLSPTLSFFDTDPDVDNITYEIEVDTSSSFGTGIATPAQVQSVFSTPATALTNAATFGSSVTVGNTIIVATNDNNGSVNSISNVTDSLGNTYARATADTESSFVDGEIWYGNITTGGSCTVTIHTAASSVTLGFGAVEYSGILEPIPLDKTAVGHAITGTAMTTAASAATTNANEVVISALLTNGTGTTTFTAGAGYGHLVQHADATSGVVVGIQDKTISSTGTQTATGTISSSGHWVILLATFILQNNPPLIDKLSASDVGFVDTTSGDTDPFFSGDTIAYTVQISLTPATTYFWRVRGKDPSGTNTFGAWSSTFSFTAQSGTTFTQALAGSISFVGNRNSSTAKSMTASVSFSGSLSRSIRKTITAAISFSGSLGRFIKKTMSAAVSFVGNFTAGVFHLVALAAAISFSGSLPRKTSKGMTAAVSFSAALNRLVGKGMTAAVSFSGSLPKSIAKTLAAAAVSFSGAIARRTGKSMTAAVSFVGSIPVRAIVKNMAASVSFSGSLPRITKKGMTAAVSFSGSINKLTRKGISAAISFVGNFIAGVLHLVTLTASISFSGNVTRRVGKSLAASLGFNGSPDYALQFSGGSNGFVSAPFTFSTTNYSVLFRYKTATTFGNAEGFMAQAGSVSIGRQGLNDVQAYAYLNASADFAGLRRLRVGRNLAFPITDGQWHSRAYVFYVNGANHGSVDEYEDGAFVRTSTTDFTGDATTPSGNLRIGSQGAAGGLTFNGTMDRVVILNRSVSAGEILTYHNGTLPSAPDALWEFNEGTGTAANDTSGNANNGTLSGSALPAWVLVSPILTLLTKKGIAAAVSFVGSILKLTTKTAFTAALSFAGSLITGTVHKLALAASISFSGAITRRTNKGMTASISFSGALSRFISKGMSAAVSFVGSNLRKTLKSMTASVSFSGAINRLTKKGLAAAISFSGSVSRLTKKGMTAAVSFSAALAKRTAKGLAASVSFVGSVLNNAHNHFTMLLTASVSFSGSMNKRTKKTMSSSVSFVGAMATSLVALIHHFADPIILSLSTFLNNLTASSPELEMDVQDINVSVGLQDVIVTLPLSNPIINLELGSAEPLNLGVS